MTPARQLTGVALEDLGGGTCRLTWQVANGADTYSVTRGSLSTLEWGRFGECVAAGLTGTTLDDTDVPPPSDGFTYLVQGVSDGCGPGSLGYANGGLERVNLDPAACPGP